MHTYMHQQTRPSLVKIMAVIYICVDNLAIIGSNNGLLPEWHQTIIWTNAGILLIRSLGTNFSEILIKIYTLSFKKMHLKMLSGKCQPSCLGLMALSQCWQGLVPVIRKVDCTKCVNIHTYSMVLADESQNTSRVGGGGGGVLIHFLWSLIFSISKIVGPAVLTLKGF